MKLNKLLFIPIAIFFLFSCNQGLEKKNNTIKDKSMSENKQSDPTWVVNQIFKAAKNSDYKVLMDLCDPKGEGDGDTRNICSMHSSSDKDKNEFNDYFKLGKIIGDPVIEGNKAKIQFKFGPSGNKDETMNLIKREDKWYLSSF